MYDMWYTMGVAVIRPALVAAIGKPNFTFVRRELIERDSTGAVVFQTNGASTTGNIDKTDSALVRSNIASFVKQYSPSAPPIGLYCAGRFCQLVNIAKFDTGTPGDTSLQAIVNLFHNAYVLALGSGPESSLPIFPAFLGLMTFDATLVSELNPTSARVQAVLTEFGITAGSREFQIASQFGAAADFAKAAQWLMEGDSTPWDDNPTEEPIFYWDDEHSSHLVP